MPIETFDNPPHTRIAWLDIAKGYGIILVIFAHLGVGEIGTWIYTFHMPLFFFLSGFVFNPNYNFKTFIQRKFHSIIIPYFSLGIPMIVFQLFWDYHMGTLNHETLKNLLVDFCVQKRMWTLWYLACLFDLNLFFYLIVCKIKKQTYIVIFSSIMFCIGIVYYHYGGKALPWNIDVCLTAILFFAFGYWFRNHYHVIRSKITPRISLFLFVICVIINVLFGFLGTKIAGCGLDMAASSYGCPPLTVISAFSGIFWVIIISHWFNLAFIKYIGKNTLVYYAWHQTIMIPLFHEFLLRSTGIDSEQLGPIKLMLERFVALFVILFALTLCNIVISNTKLKYMLGR